MAWALLALLVTAGASPSAAQVLVWSTGNSLASTQGVANWIGQLGGFSSVTAYEGTALTLSDLQSYDRILFFTNSNVGSSPLVGDVLADFAATGRRLVVTTFSWANQGDNTLGGRFITGGFSPVTANGSTLYSSASMASNDGSALFSGVSTITGYYRDIVAPTSGAVVNATWSDGNPFVVTKANVIAVTLFPDDGPGFVSGDYRQLFANALGGSAAVPEPGVITLIGIGLLLIASCRRPFAGGGG